jgi:hypothetical protein
MAAQSPSTSGNYPRQFVSIPDELFKQEPKKIDSRFFTREVMGKQGDGYVMTPITSINRQRWAVVRTTLKDGDFIRIEGRPPKTQDARMAQHLQNYLHLLHLQTKGEKSTIFLEVTALVNKISFSKLFATFHNQIIPKPIVNKEGQTETHWIVPCTKSKKASTSVDEIIYDSLQSNNLEIEPDHPTRYLHVTPLVNEKTLPLIWEACGSCLKREKEEWIISCQEKGKTPHKMRAEEMLPLLPGELKGLIGSCLNSDIFSQKIPFPLKDVSLVALRPVINEKASKLLNRITENQRKSNLLLFDPAHPVIEKIEPVRKYVNDLSLTIPVTAKELVQIALFFPHLKSLKLYGVTDDTVISLENFPELESLEFASSSISGKNFSHLPKNIKFLKFSSNHLSNEIFKELANHSKLETLIIDEEVTITGENIDQLPKSLKKLSFSRCYLLSEELPLKLKDFEHLEELYVNRAYFFRGTYLGYLPKSLKRLSLVHCMRLTEESMKELQDLNIEYLDISENDIRGKYFSYLPKSLRSLICSLHEMRPSWHTPSEEADDEETAQRTLYDLALPQLQGLNNLQEVNLSGTYISGKHLNCLPQSVKILDLSRCKRIKDETISLLNKHSHLEHLDLNHTKIRGSFFKDLPQSIKELDCHDCLIPDDSAILSLKHLTHLKMVDLNGTKISGKLFSNLPQSLEELKITLYEELPQSAFLGLKEHKNLTVLAFTFLKPSKKFLGYLPKQVRLNSPQ